MAGEFAVKTSGLKSAANQYGDMQGILLTHRYSLEVIKGQLDGNTYKNVAKVLGDIINSQTVVGKGLRDLQSSLEEISEAYSNAERSLLGIRAGYVEITPETYVENIASLISLWGDIEEENLTIKDIVLKKGLGVEDYFKGDKKPSSRFFKEFIKKEIDEFKKFDNIFDGAGSVAKWAGKVTTGISNYRENKEECAAGEISEERVWIETGIETVVDLGIDFLTTAGAVVILGSAATTLGVTVVAGTGVMVASMIFKEATGKDIGEGIADFICDKVVAVPKKRK